jgi:hypothetical protein
MRARVDRHRVRALRDRDRTENRVRIGGNADGHQPSAGRTVQPPGERIECDLVDMAGSDIDAFDRLAGR